MTTPTRERIINILCNIRPSRLTIYTAADAILALFAEQTARVVELEAALLKIFSKDSKFDDKPGVNFGPCAKIAYEVIGEKP